MTECVKIKCDDCKFQEECVDYGWEGCRKFTPKPSEPMTEEEWFCGLSTEEKAKFLDSSGMRYCECGCKACVISEQCKSGGIRKTQKEMWVEWLKQPHTPKE